MKYSKAEWILVSLYTEPWCDFLALTQASLLKYNLGRFKIFSLWCILLYFF